jgi:hypothetical protein
MKRKGRGGEKREMMEKEGVRSAPDHVAGPKEREGRGEEKREKEMMEKEGAFSAPDRVVG